MKVIFGRRVNTREAVIDNIDHLVDVLELEGIFKVNTGPNWYLTFKSTDVVDHLAGGEKRDPKPDSDIKHVIFERVDTRHIKFRIHWYPIFMSLEAVENYMGQYGTQIYIDRETQQYKGIKLFNGAITGDMVVTDSNYMEIPYRTTIQNRQVLITVIMNYFLTDLPVLDYDDMHYCEKPIVLDEIKESLFSMENNKSPGPDGLTKEFYMKFFDIFGPLLLELYENCYDENTLSESQKLSYITLICKDSAKHDDVKFYTPIGLMNYDVKILSKLICKRMGFVSDKIVGIDQTCAIKGRSILENAHLHRNIVDYVNQKILKCCFLSVDQEKAFDKSIHKFLFAVLEKFGFGQNLIKWIKILYHDLILLLLLIILFLILWILIDL